jgi:chemotaxis protein CheC
VLDVGRWCGHRLGDEAIANGRQWGIDNVTDGENHWLDASKLARLETSFHRGSADASWALARWIGRPSVVEIDSLEQLPLEEATGMLAAGEDPICFCSVEMTGCLVGEMILAFDDTSGLALADMALDQPRGTTTQWTEMATSAALETTNILCCAYLNSLARALVGHEGLILLPSPPSFHRDFAESLMQFALMGQAVASNQVIVARTMFEIDKSPANWTLLFVPDAQSMERLSELLLGTGE